jgi:hypothetical protein
VSATARPTPAATRAWPARRAVRACVLRIAVVPTAFAATLPAQAPDVPLPSAAVPTPRAAPRLAVYMTGSVGRAPARAFGGVVDRTLASFVVEWQQPILGTARRGVAWAPAFHPALSMSRVPTADALIFYDCASALVQGVPGAPPCTAKWSDAAQARALALEPLAFRLWQRAGRVELSLRPGIGVTRFARAVPIPEGRRVNALLRLDAGAAVAITPRDRLHLQFGWWHVSNAGRGALNPGVDALQLQAGVSHAWGR